MSDGSNPFVKPQPAQPPERITYRSTTHGDGTRTDRVDVYWGGPRRPLRKIDPVPGTEAQTREQSIAEQRGLARPEEVVFVCDRCHVVGRLTSHPHTMVVPPGGQLRGYYLECPQCGGEAEIVNLVDRERRPGVFIFGDLTTQEAQWDALRSYFSSIGDDRLSITEAADVIASAAPELSWFATWLRDNQDLFGGIQAAGTIVGIVLALLALVLQVTDDDTEPAPPGITQEQMQELIDEVRSRDPAQQDGKTERGGRDGHGRDAQRAKRNP